MYKIKLFTTVHFYISEMTILKRKFPCDAYDYLDVLLHLTWGEAEQS